MKKGDIIKIEGYLGFLKDPEMEVVEVKNTLVTLKPYPSTEDGLLSHLNESIHGIELLNASPVEN